MSLRENSVQDNVLRQKHIWLDWLRNLVRHPLVRTKLTKLSVDSNLLCTLIMPGLQRGRGAEAADGQDLFRVPLHRHNTHQPGLEAFIKAQHIGVALEQVSGAVEAQPSAECILELYVMQCPSHPCPSGEFAVPGVNRTSQTLERHTHSVVAQHARGRGRSVGKSGVGPDEVGHRWAGIR